MKKQILFLSAVALLALNTSCNKDSDTPTPNPTNPNPTNPNPTNPNPTNPTGPTPSAPYISGVDGTLASVIMDLTTTNEYLPTPIIIKSEVASVSFPASNGTDLLPAGTVSVNGIELNKADNNGYYQSATEGQTPSTLNFTSGSDWSVGGAGSITGFSYSHTGAFPEFEGSLPTSITKSEGVTINLDGNVSNADSVYLVITAGNTFIQTGVGGNASSISLTSAQLQDLPLVSDNTAYIQVVPFYVTLESISGKQYAFVKLRAAVGSININ